jgi:hypothetical protein
MAYVWIAYFCVSSCDRGAVSVPESSSLFVVGSNMRWHDAARNLKERPQDPRTACYGLLRQSEREEISRNVFLIYVSLIET